MQEKDYKSLPSILDIVNESLHLRTARIIKRRMEGASLRDIAVEEGITRTEARSTEKKGLEKIFTDKLIVREDEYRYLYETYSFEDEFYQSLINGNQILYYLKNRYESGFGSVERALQDAQITEKIKSELKSYYKAEDSESGATDVSGDSAYEGYSSEEVHSSSSYTLETPAPTFVAETVNYMSSADTHSTDSVPQYVRDAINDLWNTFQACGITEPSKILEQASIFFFLKYLDDAELKNTADCFANGTTVKSLYFDADHQSCRWSHFHNLDSNELFREFSYKILPFIKTELRVDTKLTYAQLIQNVQLSITDPTLLTKIISIIDSITASSHVNLYAIFEILVSISGSNLGFMELVYHLLDMQIEDTVCNAYPDNDFSLSSIAAYFSKEYKKDLDIVWHKIHFKNEMFHTYNANSHVLLISTLRLLLQDITTPDIQGLDIITADCKRTFTKVIAKIPVKPAITPKNVNSSIKSMITANIPSLMYMYGCHEVLEPNGICLLNIPHKNLIENTASHRRLRKFYLQENNVLAIIHLPLTNRDLLIYKKCNPLSFHQTLFAQIDDFSSDIIYSVCALMYDTGVEPSEYQDRSQLFFYVSDSEIEDNDYNLGYEAYSTRSQDSVVVTEATEKLDVILRRIYNTQSDIDKSIGTIKKLLENL